MIIHEQDRALPDVAALSAPGKAESTPVPDAEGARPSLAEELKGFAAAVGRWPLTVKLSILAIVLLYIPVLKEAYNAWMTNENYAHGILILPISAVLLWMRRDEIRQATPNPTAWGLVPLVFGLALQASGYLLTIGFLAIISLIPVLAGAVLLLHGRRLWAITRFAICFLVFASTIPGSITAKPSGWIQKASTTGAVQTVKLFGMPIIQTGNMMEIPGMELEVAEVCSGFKKLTALIAFGALFGHMFRIGWGKRLLLIFAAIPIAVAANSLRVAGLVFVSFWGGERALHIAHDWAEIVVLVFSFIFFVLLGKLIGCKTLRHSL